jgi:hypothetical protein
MGQKFKNSGVVDPWVKVHQKKWSPWDKVHKKVEPMVDAPPTGERVFQVCCLLHRHRVPAAVESSQHNIPPDLQTLAACEMAAAGD